MREMEQKKYDVFISYSRKDYLDDQMNEIPGNVISLIKQAFSKSNISYWIDEEGIDAFQNYVDIISSIIESTPIIVFVYSENSKNAKWIEREIALADEQEKTIIPLQIGNTPIDYKNKTILRIINLNFINYDANPVDAINKLINAIQNRKKYIEQKITVIESSYNMLIQEEASIECERQRLLNDIDKLNIDKNKKVELKMKIISSASTKDNHNSGILNYMLNDEQNDKNGVSEIPEPEIEHKQTKIEGPNYKIKNKRIILSSIIVSLIAFGIGYLLNRYLFPEPTLVFAGGGSVYNYILEHPVDGDTIDLRSYNNAIYINQPSGNAWTLLFEEAMSDKKKFCSVCLSADLIDTSDLIQKYTAFAEKARIVQLLIGHDPLKVYADKKLPLSIFGNDNDITPHRLCEVINDSIKYTLRLFSTTRNSGTFRTYNNYFSKEENGPNLEYLYENKQCPPFYEDAKSDYLRALNDLSDPNKIKNYIVLGSEYYKPKNKDVIGTYNSLIVKDNNDDYILQKPIYLYFIAREENNQFIINNRIIEFLKKIDATQYIDKNYWNSMNNENGYIASDGKLIISINDTTISPYTDEIKRLKHLESSHSKK